MYADTVPLLFVTSAILTVFLVFFFIRFLVLRLQIGGLTKRTVFITGCDTGFGNMLARALDAKSVSVFAGCLTQQGARDLEKVSSSRLKTVQLDITDKKAVTRAYQFVQDNLGKTQELWGVVNNAGVMPSYAPIEWTSIEEFENVFKVNVFGTISVTLTFLPLLRKSHGRLITVCSVTATCALPGIANYVVSKSAAKMFTDCLRRELFNTGVTAHTIEPGGFDTGITNTNRLTTLFKAAYKRATPELQECYGGSIASFVMFGIRHAGFFKNDPNLVSEAMVHALLARFPKRQYIVGPDANFFFRPLMLFPNKIIEFVLNWPKTFGPKACELEGL